MLLILPYRLLRNRIEWSSEIWFHAISAKPFFIQERHKMNLMIKLIKIYSNIILIPMDRWKKTIFTVFKFLAEYVFDSKSTFFKNT